MYLNDILAGIIMVLSVIFIFLSAAGYHRYHLKALLMNVMVFSVFLIDSVIYAINSLYALNLDIITILLLSDTIILVIMYMAVALKG